MSQPRFPLLCFLSDDTRQKSIRNHINLSKYSLSSSFSSIFYVNTVPTDILLTHTKISPIFSPTLKIKEFIITQTNTLLMFTLVLCIQRNGSLIPTMNCHDIYLIGYSFGLFYHEYELFYPYTEYINTVGDFLFDVHCKHKTVIQKASI